MRGANILALALLVGGALGLMYGGFTYTKGTHKAEIGSLELSVRDQQTINLPVWAGVGAMVIGGVLLFLQVKRS